MGDVRDKGARLPEGFMLTHDSRITFGNDATNLSRRAFYGACWSVGISPCPHVTDTLSMTATRDALARAIVHFASTGMRDMPAMKTNALRLVMRAPALAKAA
jgi:hypothetical protein